MSDQIPLSRGQFALVDARDHKRLSRHRWHCTANGYAARTVFKRKRRTTVYMHRVLLKAPKGVLVDHRNGDTLDNRRDNLRLVTAQQNQMNQRKQRQGSSSFKGVSRHRNRWQARIWVDGKSKHLGYFDSEIMAAWMYDVAAREYFGPYARLNIPALSRNSVPLAQYQAGVRERAAARRPVKPSIERRPSPYRGVYCHRGRWRAVIGIGGHKHHLGYFTDEVEAAQAYDTAARAAHGLKAVVNFDSIAE